MLSPSMTLTQFWEAYYRPICLADPQPRTIEEYERTLDRWARFTGDPPLEQITPAVLRDYCERLKMLTGKTGKPISVNTVRKHLRHVQPILDRAGPPHPRCRDAAGLIPVVPWIKPPRALFRQPMPPRSEDIIALYLCADEARWPQIEGLRPAAWWRAQIALICSTSLRIGQTSLAPMDSVSFADRVLILPAELCHKSRREEYYPLHPVAIRDLMAVRGRRELLLPIPGSRSAIYREMERLEIAAGIPPHRRFRFHALRRSTLTALAKISAGAAQQAAGHASFDTTRRHYLGIEVLADAVRQLPLFDRLAAE